MNEESEKRVSEIKNSEEVSKIQENENESSRWKPILKYTVSIVNGIMFMAISEVGGMKLTEVIHLAGPAAQALNHILSGLGGVVYATFYYKILEDLKIQKPENISQVLLSVLTLITSLSYLEGSFQGSQLLGIPSEVALPFCILFFLFRVLACTDSSLKFPEKIKEMLKEFKNAWEEKDYKELSRILISFLTGIGYSVCSMDSVYSSVERILQQWIKINFDMRIISFVAGILGGMGMFPFALNWTYRGIQQLSWGGKKDDEGNQPDPTDKYTVFAVLCVLPEVLGILGATIGQQGSFLGFTISQTAMRIVDILKVFFSSIYTIAGDIPGMSTLIRAFSEKTEEQSWGSYFSCNFFKENKQEEDSSKNENYTHSV